GRSAAGRTWGRVRGSARATTRRRRRARWRRAGRARSSACSRPMSPPPPRCGCTWSSSRSGGRDELSTEPEMAETSTRKRRATMKNGAGSKEALERHGIDEERALSLRVDMLLYRRFDSKAAEDNAHERNSVV